jgi:hypothetical protein
MWKDFWMASTYVAEGEWDLLPEGAQRVRMVAGNRFEPLHPFPFTLNI